MRIALITISSIIGIFALIFLANEFEIFGMKFWGVRKENARREIFEESQSFVEGKRQAALKYYQEYQKADENGKKTIKYVVSTEFANFDEKKLDPKLQEFIYQCKYN